MNAEMARCGLRRWQVRFADVEPDLDAFVTAYVQGMGRPSATGGYGRWLNPLGRWDWWDLASRFDGLIIGERRRPGARRTTSASSNPETGRTILANVTDVLVAALSARTYRGRRRRGRCQPRDGLSPCGRCPVRRRKRISRRDPASAQSGRGPAPLASVLARSIRLRPSLSSASRLEPTGTLTSLQPTTGSRITGLQEWPSTSRIGNLTFEALPFYV
jgi:hypothetical protein